MQGDKERCDMGPFGFAEDQSCLGMGIVYILSIPVLIDTVIDSIWCKKIWWKNFKLFYYCWILASVLKFFSQKQWVIFLVVFYFINIKGIVHPFSPIKGIVHQLCAHAHMCKNVCISKQCNHTDIHVLKAAHLHRGTKTTDFQSAYRWTICL